MMDWDVLFGCGLALFGYLTGYWVGVYNERKARAKDRDS
jgi:hypothetical protein